MANTVRGGFLRDETGALVVAGTPGLADSGVMRRAVLSGSSGLNVGMTQWGSGREFRGFDPITGFFYFLNSSGFYRSQTPASSMSGISLPSGAPLTGNRAKVVRFGAYLYLQTATSSDGSTPPAIYRSDPTTISWTKVKDLGAASDIIMTAFNADASYLYVGEYSTAAQGETSNRGPTNGLKIYRLPIGTSDGTNWETVLNVPRLDQGGARHCHAVAPDPYNPGHVWATFGDNNSDRKIMRSTDYGANWTTVPVGASFQAVQISFSKNWVWFAGDAPALGGLTVFTIDRDTLTAKWATLDYHRSIPVPGGASSRAITDLATTASSGAASSATAAFTAADVGKFLYDTQAYPDGTFIQSVTNSTNVVMSQQAANTLTNQAVTIGGDEWFGAAYQGAVDPSTERYYCVAQDATVGGTKPGLFVLDQPGGKLTLMRRLHAKPDDELFILNGAIWVHRFQIPLPDGAVTSVKVP